MAKLRMRPRQTEAQPAYWVSAERRQLLREVVREALTAGHERDLLRFLRWSGIRLERLREFVAEGSNSNSFYEKLLVHADIL